MFLTDKEAVDAFKLLTRIEGIISALENYVIFSN